MRWLFWGYAAATSAEVYMYHRQKEMDIRSKIDYLSKRAVNAFRSGQVAVASQLKGEIGALRLRLSLNILSSV
eukprot:scaffold849_cov386-Prasinococcus_capsulatus_cf.AAC.18